MRTGLRFARPVNALSSEHKACYLFPNACLVPAQLGRQEQTNGLHQVIDGSRLIAHRDD